MVEIKISLNGTKGIADMYIVNDDTGNEVIGNYDVTYVTEHGARRGRVEDHPRMSSISHLVTKALISVSGFRPRGDVEQQIINLVQQNQAAFGNPIAGSSALEVAFQRLLSHVEAYNELAK